MPCDQWWVRWDTEKRGQGVLQSYAFSLVEQPLAPWTGWSAVGHGNGCWKRGVQVPTFGCQMHALRPVCAFLALTSSAARLGPWLGLFPGNGWGCFRADGSSVQTLCQHLWECLTGVASAMEQRCACGLFCGSLSLCHGTACLWQTES